MNNFGDAERKVLFHLSNGSEFKFDGKMYVVKESGKPTCYKGEPKTDVYIKATNIINTLETVELKISFKKENADFLENKMSAIRAEQILGPNWKNIIIEATSSKKHHFYSRDIVYKSKKGHTNEGSITLGWKFELLNKPSGSLSGLMPLSHDEIIDVYSGTNISTDKKHALVNGKKINNSGIANYILMNDSLHSAQQVIDSLVAVEDYVEENPKIYYACKALNYRTFHKRWDGNRPLAVYVDWQVNNGRLDPIFKFDNPLLTKGNEVARKLVNSLKKLNIKTTDDINPNNLTKSDLIND